MQKISFSTTFKILWNFGLKNLLKYFVVCTTQSFYRAIE